MMERYIMVWFWFDHGYDYWCNINDNNDENEIIFQLTDDGEGYFGLNLVWSWPGLICKIEDNNDENEILWC